MRRSILAGGLLLTLVACTASHGPGLGDGGAARSDAGTPEAYAGSYVMADCAPDDGAAIRLLLWDVAVPECSADGESRSLSFYFFSGADTVFPITAPQTITSDTSSGGFGNGVAMRCPGGRPPCVRSTGWTLSFDTFARDVGASGTYSVTFEGGSTSTGSFEASWCMAGELLCG